MERIVVRKLGQDLERRNILPQNEGGYRAGKTIWENAARFAYDVYQGFQRKEQTLAVAVDLEDAHNRVQFKLQMEILFQYCVGFKMACSSTPGKEGCHATWKLYPIAATTDNGTSTRLPSVPSPLQCLHKGTGGSEQQWSKWGSYACA